MMKALLYTTQFSARGEKHADVRPLRFMPDNGVEKEVVNLHPQVKYQTWEGFGGAFTDAAGYIFAQMDAASQKKLIDAYYGAGGLGYTIGRTHIDSCDFSIEPYQAMADASDRGRENFSIERGVRYIMPLLQAAQRSFGGPIPLLTAPWSPPDFMKTNKERIRGGSLLPEYRAMYADYLCRYIGEMRQAGARIVRLTVQNEQNAVQTWDSCIYPPAEEKEFIRDFLHPALQKHGLGDVELFIWDHNKERVFERACAVLDDITEKMVAGIAFHWYSGDHFEALDFVHARFPDKKMVQSEACIEYSLFDAENFLDNAEKYGHEIIGDMNHGMSAFYDWNLVLDEKGGPNHVDNYCDAPFLYHTDTGKLEERASYAYIGHFSKYIQPGARRIALSRYSDAVEATAFENPGGALVAVFMNRTLRPLPVVLRLEGEITSFTLQEKSISTFVIGGKNSGV